MPRPSFLLGEAFVVSFMLEVAMVAFESTPAVTCPEHTGREDMTCCGFACDEVFVVVVVVMMAFW